MSDLHIIPWDQHPGMIRLTDAIKAKLPGWDLGGPLTPGDRPWHECFIATKDGERKVVNVHTETLEVIIECLPRKS